MANDVRVLFALKVNHDLEEKLSIKEKLYI